MCPRINYPIRRVVGQVASESGYSSSYSFDANGNLETLKRNAWDGNASILMDDFEYHYNETINNGHNNRLSGITDHAGASLFQDADIDHSITSNNYKYDEIGQLIEDLDEGIDTIKWTVTNKVKEIQYENGDFISFDYDAMGNRIAKHVTKSGHTVSTYYFLDAQGNQMAMYQHKNEGENGISNNNLYLSERNLYGSSRIGQEQIGEIIASSDLNLVNINTATQNIIGDKYFEMSNHLGNVLEVVSDRKLPVPDGNGNIDYFLADVVSYSDYYPYGMQMPGRNGSTGEYRYGFQGQEKDDEVKGEGNSVNYKYRMHDPRVGRFFAVDPLARVYSYNSPYAFSENRLIDGVEFEGLEVTLVGVQGSGSALLSGAFEGGAAITPDGIYGYTSYSIGVETNASIGDQISITYFPNMPKSKDAEGWGIDVGVSGGEALVAGVNYSYSGGYSGVNFTVGAGLGVLPLDGSAYATYTTLEPLTDLADINDAIDLLNDSKKSLNDELKDLKDEMVKLENKKFANENKGNNVDNLKNEIKELKNTVSTKKETLEQLETGLEKLKQKKEEIE